LQFTITARSPRHCEERSNPEGKIFLAGAIQKKELYCARHDFVILLYWIASFFAMTPEARRYCAKQSNSREFTGFAIRNNRTFAASLRGTKQSRWKNFSCLSDSEERVILRSA
jgi:hypothetical protein